MSAAPPRSFWRRWRPLLIVGGAIFVVVMLMVLRPSREPPAPEERAWPVEALVVRFGTVRPRSVSYGEIFAAREVELRTQISGEIVEVQDTFAEGGYFLANEPILQIDSFHYSHALDEARASLSGARATLAERHTEFYLAWKEAQRGDALFARGTIAIKERDDFRSRYLSAKARYRQQKSMVERTESEMARAARNLRDTTVRAPSDGFVGNLLVQRGQQVSAGSKLADFIDAGSYEVRFNISDTDYGRLLASNTPLVGLPVRLHWKVGEEELRLRAQVTRQGSRIAATTRGVDLFAKLIPPLPSNLRVGAFVQVVLEGRELNQVVVLPRTALFTATQVMVIENERLTLREVALAASDEQNIYVDAGLSEGEQVLLTRFEAAREGVLVRVEAKEAEPPAPAAREEPASNKGKTGEAISNNNRRGGTPPPAPAAKKEPASNKGKRGEAISNNNRRGGTPPPAPAAYKADSSS